jgi:hypothetical protein
MDGTLTIPQRAGAVSVGKFDVANSPRGKAIGLAGISRRRRKWGRPCGRPHSHRRVVSAKAESLTPGVFRTLAVRQRCYVARRSRRCRFRRGSGWSEDLTLPPGSSATVQWALLFKSNSAGHCRPLEAGRKARPADCAPSKFQRCESCECPKTLLALVPPPRGISPSRRRQFQNLLIFQGLTPSIRRANPCFR